MTNKADDVTTRRVGLISCKTSVLEHLGPGLRGDVWTYECDPGYEPPGRIPTRLDYRRFLKE